MRVVYHNAVLLSRKKDSRWKILNVRCEDGREERNEGQKQVWPASEYSVIFTKVSKALILRPYLFLLKKARSNATAPINMVPGSGITISTSV